MSTNYTIIEDCSPYYIRFTFDGLDKIIEFLQQQDVPIHKSYPNYIHHIFDVEVATQIRDMLPMSKVMSIGVKKMNMFDTPSFGGVGPHKDGVEVRCSFNIPIKILDDLCETVWYESSQFDGMEWNVRNEYTRNMYNHLPTIDQFKTLKKMVAKPNEMLLFNTEIFHSWYNKSPHNRKIVTIRTTADECGDFYFEDAKKLIFGL
jgi:hypothetical protein